MTRNDAIELIERIPFITTFTAPSTKDLLDSYRKALNKKDPVQWVKVVKSCYLRKDDTPSAQTFGTLQKQYGLKAKKILHGELASALDIKEDEVEPFIKNYLEKM
jgi:RNA polymerase-interacting CarD/CdnL/TRCF family regulator